RERLAAPELSEARRVLAEGGMPALVEHAHTALLRADRARARFEILSRDLDRAHRTSQVEEATTLLEGYLRETVEDPRRLRADLKALAMARKARSKGKRSTTSSLL